MRTIKVNLSDIKATNSFQNATPTQQSVYSGRSSVKIIQNGVNISKNIGFENWVKQSSPFWLVREIVKELTINNQI